MSSILTVLNVLRNFKNTPATAVAERVLMENGVDNSNAMVCRRAAIVEQVALGGAAQVTLTNSLPAGAKVIFAGVYLETAVVLTTATNLAVGTTATPSAFYLSGATMAIGTKDVQPSADANSRVAVATPIRLTTTNGGGALTGTGTGTVKVIVVYEYCTSPVA